MNQEPDSTCGSGNPYADLGMADAELQIAKAQLALRIIGIMREPELTQAQLAEKLGIDQPQVSRLTRGQLGTFSLERLMTLVQRLDQDIEIMVRDNPGPARPAHLVVNTETHQSPPVAAIAVSPQKISFD